MPISTHESEQDRHLLLQSLQAFGRGDEEAPLVSKWTNSVADGFSLNSKASAVESEDQAIAFVLSTDDVDRHGDVIAADGWVLNSYRTNPVLLTQLQAQNDWVRRRKPRCHSHCESPVY